MWRSPLRQGYGVSRNVSLAALDLIQSRLTAQGPVVPGDTKCLFLITSTACPEPPVQSTVTRLIKCSQTNIDETTYPGAPGNTLTRW